MTAHKPIGADVAAPRRSRRRRAREAMLYRLQAAAKRCRDFPPAAVWLDDLDAIEAEVDAPLRAALDVELGPPGPGAIQRRCWTITNEEDEIAQCWLYNGHAGQHQFAAAGEGPRPRRPNPHAPSDY